jgi:hypothetical protein
VLQGLLPPVKEHYALALMRMKQSDISGGQYSGEPGKLPASSLRLLVVR